MSASVLRNRYLREFAGLGKYRAWAAWMIVAGYVFQAGLAVILGCWIVAQPIGWPSAVAIVVLMLFIGTRLRGLNNIIHDGLGGYDPIGQWRVVEFVGEFSDLGGLGIRPSIWGRFVGMVVGKQSDSMVRPMSVAATSDGNTIFVAG